MRGKTLTFHRLPLKSDTFKKSQMSEQIDVPSGCVSVHTNNANECSNLNVSMWSFNRFWSHKLIQLFESDLNENGLCRTSYKVEAIKNETSWGAFLPTAMKGNVFRSVCCLGAGVCLGGEVIYLQGVVCLGGGFKSDCWLCHNYW